jgi:type I restriction enzyme M protein
MAKRHEFRPGEWDSVMGRLQELVLANSGEDEFQEVFKLVAVKLVMELVPGAAQAMQCASSPSLVAERFNALLAVAAERWKGILEPAVRSALTDEHLAVCMDVMKELSVSGSDLEVLDGVFEYLVSRVAKGAKGQYFTPRQVVDFCVKAVDPGPREVVVDPACGSGGFLVHTLEHNRGRLCGTPVSSYCSRCLWGFDFDQRAVQVAKALMLVAGDGLANIARVNSLLLRDAELHAEHAASGTDGVPMLAIEDVMRSRTRGFAGFDVVMTNPPFAGEIREAALLRGFQLAKQGRRMERDVLFLERCVRLLRRGGRLAIVLPHNKLAGASWAYIRQWLVRHVRIVAVLGLDRNTFLPHTHQKTAVLFGVRRDKPAWAPSAERVLFMCSDSSGKDAQGRGIELPGVNKTMPAWQRLDHDLACLLPTLHDFIRSEGIQWGES